MFVEMVTLNLFIPTIKDTRVLEILGAGVTVLLDGHFNNGLDLEDFTLVEHAKLTMGDQTSDMCFGDEDFESMFSAASRGLSLVLAVHGDDLKSFATQVTCIADIMVFEYPGLIRLCVRESGGAYGNNLLYL